MAVTTTRQRDSLAARQRIAYERLLDDSGASWRLVFSEKLQLAKDLAKLNSPKAQTEAGQHFRYLFDSLDPITPVGEVISETEDAIALPEYVELHRCYSRFLRYEGLFHEASAVLQRGEEGLLGIRPDQEAETLMLPFWKQEFALEHFKLARAIPDCALPEYILLKQQHATRAQGLFEEFIDMVKIGEQEASPMRVFTAQYRLAQIAKSVGNLQNFEYHIYEAATTRLGGREQDLSKLPRSFVGQYLDAVLQASLFTLQQTWNDAQTRGMHRKIPERDAAATHQSIQLLIQTLANAQEAAHPAFTKEEHLLLQIYQQGQTLIPNSLEKGRPQKQNYYRSLLGVVDSRREFGITPLSSQLLPLREMFTNLDTDEPKHSPHISDIVNLIKLISWFYAKHDGNGAYKGPGLSFWYVTRLPKSHR